MAVPKTPRPKSGVGVKSNKTVETAQVQSSARTLANVLRTLPANLMTKAVRSAPATCAQQRARTRGHLSERRTPRDSRRKAGGRAARRGAGAQRQESRSHLHEDDGVRAGPEALQQPALPHRCEVPLRDGELLQRDREEAELHVAHPQRGGARREHLDVDMRLCTVETHKSAAAEQMSRRARRNV